MSASCATGIVYLLEKNKGISSVTESCVITEQYFDLMGLLIWVALFFILFYLISLIADGPHHYHPAYGHKGFSHLSPVLLES